MRQPRHRAMPRSAVYMKWDGTQSPFPITAEEILDEISDDLLAHGDVQAALRRLMQEGMSMRGERLEGLRETLRRIAQRRRELMEKYDPSGMLTEIAEKLDEIVHMERRGIERRLDEADTLAVGADEDEMRAVENFRQKADMRTTELDLMPDDAPGKLRALQNYDFVEPEAKRAFDELVEDLRRQAAQMFFNQASGALQNITPEDIERMKNMYADLNRMLEERAAGREPDFEKFMSEYGDLFPENPKNLDELLEAIARRMAVTQAIMSSLTPEQRAELAALVEGLLEDMDLRFQADRLASNLRQAFPQLFANRPMPFSGNQPIGMGEMAQLASEIAELEGLGDLLGNAQSPAQLAEVDIDRVRELLGDDAAKSLSRLAEVAQMLKDAGLIDRTEGRLRLTPKGMRQIGSSAIEEIFKRLQRDRAGLHETRHLGTGTERAYETKEWEWGDPFQLDVHGTVRNAIRRAGAGTPVELSIDDFEIERTEHLVTSATVLMLDMSLSMMMRDNFLPAKKLAYALQSLIATKFPRDYFSVVGFSLVAREIQPRDLPEVSWDGDYGTNLQHAFLLSRRLLASRRAQNKKIIVVTDGEPTAHIEGEEAFFAYPPVAKTLEETLKEVVRCTREKININVFMVDQSPYLVRFVEKMVEINRGRAFFTTPDRLGDFVMVDFLDSHAAGGRRSRVRPQSGFSASSWDAPPAGWGDDIDTEYDFFFTPRRTGRKKL